MPYAFRLILGAPPSQAVTIQDSGYAPSVAAEAEALKAAVWRQEAATATDSSWRPVAEAEAQLRQAAAEGYALRALQQQQGSGGDKTPLLVGGAAVAGLLLLWAILR